MTDGGRPPPWYEAGLLFRCTACGACCTGAPGYVWVEPSEIESMARARGLGVEAFRRRFVRNVRRRLSLKERANGDCVMLDGGGRCTVYRSKPLRCSTFPFWPEAIEGPATWRETAARCEGIGAGDHYAAEEIERVAAGDPTPLLAKQAAGVRVRAPAAHAPDPGRPDAAGIEEARWQAALLELGRLYADLEAELPRFDFTCAASGRCCDFDAYGHRLYVTTLEAERFFRLAPEARANREARLCPAWGPDRLCHARDARMLGCRTYFCGPYPVAPPEALHERYHARVKAIHDRHGIPFAYRDIVAWAADRRPVS